MIMDDASAYFISYKINVPSTWVGTPETSHLLCWRESLPFLFAYTYLKMGCPDLSVDAATIQCIIQTLATTNTSRIIGGRPLRIISE